MIIEDTKDIYYDKLQALSEKWNKVLIDEMEFIEYMLSVI